ncbi:MAG: GTPase, partial [Halioglobus sp.]|nr:GTPase [Halioglobus sp.]
IGQAATLVTPRAGFREGQKVTLVTAARTHKVQLTRRVSYTGSYNQFEFKQIRELGDVLAEREKNIADGDDSNWTTL